MKQNKKVWLTISGIAFVVFLPIILIIILGVVLHYVSKGQNRPSAVLGIDVSKGKLIREMDTHGGFHGDGTSYIVIHFADLGDAIEESLENNRNWEPLPLSDNLRKVAYGDTLDNGYTTALVKDENGASIFPEIEHGYYFFLDRSSESEDKKDDTKLFDRYSYNFTFAIYDLDKKVLYYCEFDT